MSMLLDALKKSDEQRRQGAQPGLQSEPEAGRADGPDPLRQWLPAVLIVASVLTMTWFGWRQFRPPVTDGDAAPVAASPALAESPAPGVRARTPVEGFTAPPPSTPVADAGPADAADRRAAAQAISEYQAPAEESAAPPAREPAGSTPPPTATATAATPESAPRAQPGRQAAGAGTPYQPGLMSYWELPQGVRDGLPPFRISVIVYAERPEDRFVLVNGVRLREKDELQSGVVLDEIRREGAVFRARNYRFLVKG